MKLTKKCDFCSKTFDLEKNKIDKKKFCNDICKNQYHSYKRSYAGILIDSGQLDFQIVKKLVEKND